MLICTGYYLTVYSTVFLCIEFISIIILFILYLRKIINLWNYPNNTYDKIDLILLYLSEIQLLLFFVRLCQNYNIFSVLVSINKFSQNLMICSLLMIIILGKYSNSKSKIINYFLITLLIADILLFLIGINDNEAFKKNDAESFSNVLIAIFCIVLDIFILYKSFFFKIKAMNKINDNLNKNKLVSLRNYDDINGNEEQEQNNDREFFNTILNQHLNNAITILSVYFYILIPFFISYITEIVLYFFFQISNDNINEKRIKNENINNNSSMDNNTYVNNSDSNYNYTNNSMSEYENMDKSYTTCIFLRDIDDYFDFGKLLICCIFFVFRDFLPYLITYLMFFYYKLKYNRRLSF